MICYTKYREGSVIQTYLIRHLSIRLKVVYNRILSIVNICFIRKPGFPIPTLLSQNQT